MNESIVGIIAIGATLLGVVLFFLIAVAISEYWDGRYDETPFEMYRDYFFYKGVRKSEGKRVEAIKRMKHKAKESE